MTRLLSAGGSDAVGVVLVGDELLLGSVGDTNGAWLARTFTAHGLRLVDVRVVPDDVGRIAEATSSLAEGVATVVVSGGIGPTSDDLTREALAELCGCVLVQDAPAARRITDWYTARGRAPGEAAMRMARRPGCATMLMNPHGSAPGVRLRVGQAVVYAVPGVPSELVSMVDAAVLPDILNRCGPRSPLRSISIEVALLGESAVAGLLADVERGIEDDPSTDLAYLARPAHVSVRVSVRESDAAAASARLDGWEARLRSALGRHVIGTDGQTLPAAVVAALAQAGSSVAAAESLTGGGVVQALTSVPGSSMVVRGGVVAYATDLKRSMLGVSRRLLEERGPFDAEVAAEMAHGVRARLGAEWGLATTGVAGPDPVEDHPVGSVVVAVSGPRGTSVRALELPGGRERVRRLTTAHVLNDLRMTLDGGNPDSL